MAICHKTGDNQNEADCARCLASMGHLGLPVINGGQNLSRKENRQEEEKTEGPPVPSMEPD